EDFTSLSKTATNVADTTYWWRVQAVDVAGSQSEWTPLWKLTVDSTAPVAEITSHTNSDVLSGSVNLVGEVTDNNPQNSYFYIETADGTFVADGLFSDGRLTHEFIWDTT